MSGLPANSARPDPLGWDFSQPWYHGSPLAMQVLLPGSTITQALELACVFSHKPQVVSLDEETQPMRLRHNGSLTGFLYQVAEEITSADVVIHPRSAMPPGLEWLTLRPLRLRLLGPVAIDPDELLGEEDIRRLREQAQRG